MTTEENELSVVNSVYLQYKGSEGAPDNSYHISSFLVTLQTENFRGKVEFEITSNHIDIVSEQLDLFCKSFFSIQMTYILKSYNRLKLNAVMATTSRSF